MATGGSEPHVPGAAGKRPRPKHVNSNLLIIINCSLQVERFQTEPVGHPCDIITYRPLQPFIISQSLKVARHKLRFFTDSFKKLSKPIPDLSRTITKIMGVVWIDDTITYTKKDANIEIKVHNYTTISQTFDLYGIMPLEK